MGARLDAFVREITGLPMRCHSLRADTGEPAARTGRGSSRLRPRVAARCGSLPSVRVPSGESAERRPDRMKPSPEPHPLRPGQRLALLGMRGLLAAAGPISRIRRSRAGYGGVSSQRYGTRAAETLEYLPACPGTPERDPVVYIHGGGWIFGRKELYSPEMRFLSEAGYPVYNLDYPLAPEHPFPVPLLALSEALRFIAARDDTAGRIHLMGDSAGGNLVMMLGLLCSEPKRFEAVDPDLSQPGLPEVKSVVSLYGVLDRLSWIEHKFPGASLMLHSYGGPGAFETAVGPELALTPCDLPRTQRPPCFLAIGTKDPLAESSRIASRHFDGDGERLELVEYPGEQHGFFNMGRRPASAQLRSDVLRFLDGV